MDIWLHKVDHIPLYMDSWRNRAYDVIIRMPFNFIVLSAADLSDRDGDVDVFPYLCSRDNYSINNLTIMKITLPLFHNSVEP